ncbi:hypothetical protein KIPB_004339 [Kipferlia bialata]|uniref:Uncharacterized protein n=1 Tax=Kipferlia bialata TaxID=797122 RepID=A0A9K3GGI3_9EUKA|nr:hypothetical protein KIPB_004339 [Kipferlia bialata]|eukprot:g4339.t1
MEEEMTQFGWFDDVGDVENWVRHGLSGSFAVDDDDYVNNMDEEWVVMPYPAPDVLTIFIDGEIESGWDKIRVYQSTWSSNECSSYDATLINTYSGDLSETLTIDWYSLTDVCVIVTFTTDSSGNGSSHDGFEAYSPGVLSIGQYILVVGGLDHESACHAYDTVSRAWSRWDDLPIHLDAALGVNLDTHTGVLFGVAPLPKGVRRRDRDAMRARELLCYRVHARDGEIMKDGEREPVNLLLETPAKRAAQ